MDNLKKIANLIRDITLARGTNAKKDLLKSGLSSDYKEDLELVLKHLFDPMITTGISKTSWNKAEYRKYDGELNTKSILEFLHNNNSGKKETSDTIRSIATDNPDIEQLIYYLATKDINIGISRGTVEKFVHIPKFEIQLGSRIDYDDVDWNRNFILTEKMDGINMTVFKEGTSVQMFARSGKEITGLDDLVEEYKKMPDGVYCGEALYSGEVEDRGELFRLSEAEINSKKDHKQIKHYLFDYCTLEEWNSERFTTMYEQELSFIKERIKEDGNITVVPFYYKGNDKAEAMKLLDKVKSENKEGLMLRYASSTYEKTRSKNLIKLKPMYTMDLRVVRLTVNNKHEDELGAAVVEFNGNEVRVGSGWTKEDRKHYWSHPEDLIDEIIEVQYMEITEDKSGKQSLRFPVFVRIRKDKTEESYD